jgi:hypothetical protein
MARTFHTEDIVLLKDYERRIGMLELCTLSRVWPGDPNYIPPVEPNEPALGEALTETTDPVLRAFILTLIEKGTPQDGKPNDVNEIK